MCIRDSGVQWLAEVGVGTVHLATDAVDDFERARAAAGTYGGWMLREHGAPGSSGFGCDTPNAALMTRIRDAFDPEHKLGRGRFDELFVETAGAGPHGRAGG